MKLTEKECRETLDRFEEITIDIPDEENNQMISITMGTKRTDFYKVFEQLINEHFELIEKYDDLVEENENLKVCYKMAERAFLETKSKNDNLIAEKYMPNSNPPLKFEELHENMWVWDNKYKQYVKIKLLFNPCNYAPLGSMKIYHDLNETTLDFVEFEENRFFRKEVKENDNLCGV